VRRAADWKEFREPLYEAEDERLRDRHLNPESGVGKGGMRRSVVDGCDSEYS
jgi:hypothetical protein